MEFDGTEYNSEHFGIEEVKSTTDFMWRSSDGNFHHPSQMETRHLFYTLKMIWNHSAPEEMKLKPYKKYNLFQGMYTEDYMKKAVKFLMAELKSRPDLELYQVELNIIQKHIERVKRHGSITS